MNLLDCLDVSQMDCLLHLKVVVFIRQEKVNLLTISAEKQCNCHQSITENWRQTEFGSKRQLNEIGDREMMGLSLATSAPTCSGQLGLSSQLNECAAGRQTLEDQVWA